MKWPKIRLRRVDVERVLIACSAALVLMLSVRGRNMETEPYEEPLEQIPVSETAASASAKASQQTVVYYEDGKYKGHMQQFTDHDQAFITTQPKTHQLAKTSHLFRAKPSSKKYRYFKVVLINRFGETFSYTIENRNNRPFLLE